MHRTRKRTLVAGTALATMALTFSSIGVAAQDDMTVGVPAVPTGYAELDQALGEDQPFAGTRVTMQTQWIGGEGDNFAAALAPFEEASGIDVTVAEVPSGQHETLVNVSLNGGAAADIIQLAQPSAIIDYATQGLLVDIGTLMDVDKLAAEHPATLPLYSSDGQVWGMPYKVDVKSVVWYPINAFADRGYEVPATWDELVALSDQIIADGEGSPWCVGMDAGPATGWIATDMIEDILLRTAGVDVYNAWAALEHPFASDEVQRAFELAGQIYFTDGYVLGGNTAILATSQTDAMDPMFSDDLANPGCWMQKQATWYGPDFFPDAKANPDGTSQHVVGEDVGLFYFPPIDEDQGNPALGAGDAFIVSSDRPEVRAVLQYLATPEGIQVWIDEGSAISANQATPADWYAGNYKLEVASAIVADATSFGFDASDLMPASGAAFWAGVVDWITANGENTEQVLSTIDQAMQQ